MRATNKQGARDAAASKIDHFSGSPVLENINSSQYDCKIVESPPPSRALGWAAGWKTG